jgi:hypothetical protein
VRRILVSFLLTLLLAAGMAAESQAHYRIGRNGVVLPDPGVTPGAARTTDAKEICAEGFRTGPFRKTTRATKAQAYEEYGVEPNKGMCAGGCEVDHLIPLFDGGEDVLANLWPQPSKGIGFHQKDVLEVALHRMVCAGKITLPEAQRCIAENWWACALKLKILDAKGKYLGSKGFALHRRGKGDGDD